MWVGEMRVWGSFANQGLLFLCPVLLPNKLWPDLVLKLCRRGLPRGALDLLCLAEGLRSSLLPLLPLLGKTPPRIGLRQADCFAVLRVRVNSSPKSLPGFLPFLVPQPPDTGGGGFGFGSACRGAGRAEDRGGGRQSGAKRGQDGSAQRDAWGGGSRAQNSFFGDTDRLEALRPISFAAGGANSMSRLQLGAESFPAESPWVGLRCGICNSSLESVTNTNSGSASQEQPNLYDSNKTQFSELRDDLSGSGFLPGTNTTHSSAATSIVGGAVGNVELSSSSSALPGRAPGDACCSDGTAAKIPELSSPALPCRAPGKVCCCGNTSAKKNRAPGTADDSDNTTCSSLSDTGVVRGKNKTQSKSEVNLPLQLPNWPNINQNLEKYFDSKKQLLALPARYGRNDVNP